MQVPYPYPLRCLVCIHGTHCCAFSMYSTYYLYLLLYEVEWRSGAADASQGVLKHG